MRYSIKFKMFLAFNGMILFFVVTSWLLNSLFLEKFYYLSKQERLKDSFGIINNAYVDDPEDISLELEKLQQNKGMYIIIQDKNFNTKYTTFNRRKDSNQKNQVKVGGNEIQSNQDYIFKGKVEQLLQGSTIIENKKDERLNSNFINLFSMLGNGDYIFLSTPVAAIQESVNTANKFFVFTGIITILIGSITIFFITRRVTKPILELNGIAQRMATLDFTKRYTASTGDEIGQLGQSINSLSEQLQKSILELTEANEKLLEDIDRKQKIDEMRKEFVSSVSHELKTPVAVIQGYAEGLKLNVNKDEENKNFYCDVIIDEAFKMNRLIKQLLELSQIESGQAQLDIEEININLLIEQLLKKNEFLLRDKNVNIVFNKEEDVFVYADYYKIEQVLMNYLNNAVNHIDEHRLIRIKTVRVENKARVSVFNSGKHIPEDSLDSIWTSFYKVDKARTRDYGGTGLGLTIVRAIQEAHGNSCGVINTEGGVEFWFDLKLEE